MTHRERVDGHLAAYSATAPADRSPEAFAAFAAARGAPVRLVHASGDGQPDRTWVRILNMDGIHGYDVDVTEPEPLVWPMDGGHPLEGDPRSLRVTLPER